jgi:hypothetical protein
MRGWLSGLLARYREMGYQAGIGRILNLLGRHALRLGQVDQAKGHLRSALERSPPFPTST